MTYTLNTSTMLQNLIMYTNRNTSSMSIDSGMPQMNVILVTLDSSGSLNYQISVS